MKFNKLGAAALALTGAVSAGQDAGDNTLLDNVRTAGVQQLPRIVARVQTDAAMGCYMAYMAWDRAANGALPRGKHDYALTDIETAYLKGNASLKNVRLKAVRRLGALVFRSEGVLWLDERREYKSLIFGAIQATPIYASRLIAEAARRATPNMSASPLDNMIHLTTVARSVLQEWGGPGKCSMYTQSSATSPTSWPEYGYIPSRINDERAIGVIIPSRDGVIY
jgi:hypothetical protein